MRLSEPETENGASHDTEPCTKDGYDLTKRECRNRGILTDQVI
jgi:hypothetical protein